MSLQPALLLSHPLPGFHQMRKYSSLLKTLTYHVCSHYSFKMLYWWGKGVTIIAVVTYVLSSHSINTLTRSSSSSRLGHMAMWFLWQESFSVVGLFTQPTTSALLGGGRGLPRIWLFDWWNIVEQVSIVRPWNIAVSSLQFDPWLGNFDRVHSMAISFRLGKNTGHVQDALRYTAPGPWLLRDPGNTGWPVYQSVPHGGTIPVVVMLMITSTCNAPLPAPNLTIPSVFNRTVDS